MSDGTIDSSDMCSQAVVERVLGDDSVTSVKIFANLESDNYDGGVVAVNPGSVGWRIERNTGDASFQNVTVRGTLNADDITAGTLDAARIAAGAITADKLTVTSLDAITANMGTLTVDSALTASGSGIIKSDNYSAGSTGWQIGADGSAEFNDVTVRGDIVSTNWDGTVPLALPDSGATRGYALDASLGIGQFKSIYATQIHGNITIPNVLGWAQVASPYYTRSGLWMFEKTHTGSVSLPATDVHTYELGWNVNDEQSFTEDAYFRFVGTTYTEAQVGVTSHSHYIATDAEQFLISNGTASKPAYAFEGDTDTGMYRKTTDQLAFAAGGTGVFYIGSSRMRPVPGTTGAPSILWTSAGSAATPAYSFEGDTDTGMYRDASNSIGWATSGVERMQLGSSALNFAAAVTGAARIKANGKGTAGSPAFTFGGDTDTGMYRHSANQLAFAVAGVQELLLGTTGFLVPNVYNTDNAGGSNVRVDADGRLHRDSSALRVKQNVQAVMDLDALADVALTPATWTKDGYADMGLIADWLAPQHPLLGVFVDNEIDDYRDRAVMAVMAAKINRLEQSVNV